MWIITIEAEDDDFRFEADLVAYAKCGSPFLSSRGPRILKPGYAALGMAFRKHALASCSTLS
jgi:hypothetical protein